MTIFTFRWPHAIGFIKAESLDKAMAEARFLWDRPYHKIKNDKGEEVWYSTTSEAAITWECV